MGQYFVFVNLDKKEVINAWDLGSGAKFWEISNNLKGLWCFLLRKSNEGGGGDIDFTSYKHIGRWAGDRVVLIGDYDKSKLYDKASDTYKDITEEIKKEYKKFRSWLG